ncbi:MAG: exo-alpha-sialidase [Acidobacteria bacterium]|nr:exo-alpha-sialidase [Acidobacteriota bacterium]
MKLSTILLAAAIASGASVEVFTAGEDSYHTYRIPAIVKTTKGTLLAFCEGRKAGRGDAGDIDLLVKRSADGGKTWGKQIVIADFGTDTIGNPAPVVDRRTGAIWLLLTRNPGDISERNIEPGITGKTRTVWVTHSKDDGRTWAEPKNITADVKKPEWTWYATGPVNGIQLANGRMVIPANHDVKRGVERYSHAIYSDDGGANWKLGGSAGPDCNESTVAELSDGSLMLNMRSYAKRNRRYVSVSKDGGLTWTQPTDDAALIEPVCQASLIRAGKNLLFSNPASTKRENMTIRLSRDNGKTWTASKVIHAAPAAYSNLVDLGKGKAGLLYERGEKGPYERITFEVLNVKDLR